MVYQQYQDPTVNKYLGYGYWWHANREKTAKITRSILIGVCLLFWSLAAYHAYGLLTAPGISELIAQTAVTRSDILTRHEKFAPQAVRVLESAVVPVGEQEVDFLATVENPNPTWQVEVEYSFSWDGGQTLPSAAFLLPGEKTVLYSAKASVASIPTAVRAEVRPITWQRVGDSRMLARLAEIASALKFSEEKITSDEGVTAVSYLAANNSIFDLVEARFLVVLSQIGRPLAVGINTLENWPAGAVVPMEYRWLKSFSPSASVKIYPRINLLSRESWKPPAGGEIQF